MLGSLRRSRSIPGRTNISTIKKEFVVGHANFVCRLCLQLFKDFLGLGFGRHLGCNPIRISGVYEVSSLSQLLDYSCLYEAYCDVASGLAHAE